MSRGSSKMVSLAPHSMYAARIKAIFHEIFNKVCFDRFQFTTSHVPVVPVVTVVAQEKVLGLHAQPLQERNRNGIGKTGSRLLSISQSGLKLYCGLRAKDQGAIHVRPLHSSPSYLRAEAKGPACVGFNERLGESWPWPCTGNNRNKESTKPQPRVPRKPTRPWRKSNDITVHQRVP